MSSISIRVSQMYVHIGWRVREGGRRVIRRLIWKCRAMTVVQYLLFVISSQRLVKSASHPLLVLHQFCDFHAIFSPKLLSCSCLWFHLFPVDLGVFVPLFLPKNGEAHQVIRGKCMCIFNQRNEGKKLHQEMQNCLWKLSGFRKVWIGYFTLLWTIPGCQIMCS